MQSRLTELFLVFLRLGLTSFGGPSAHISYFHNEFVNKKKWLNDDSFADLVGLCQALPGPASSQVGMSIGLLRSGYLGALVAWLGFTLPSAIFLILLGLGISSFQVNSSWLHGLKLVAVAVVAQAIWGMAKNLCPDTQRLLIAALSATLAILIPTSTIQLILILMGAIFGIIFVRSGTEFTDRINKMNVSYSMGASHLIVFFFLLIALPVVAKLTANPSIQIFDIFYRSGSLVFGGGHIVLPLLQAEMVDKNLVSQDLFLAGYGAAQAIPGPLFTFSAYLGSVLKIGLTGWIGAPICLLATFLPSFLIIVGVMPYWDKLRKKKRFRQALYGVNASVVGLLVAAFYNPIWSTAIFNIKDLVFALIILLLLTVYSVPVWLIAILSTLVTGLLF